MDIVAYRGAICNQKVWFIGSLKSCMQNQGPESQDEKVISLGGGGEGGDSLLVCAYRV